MTESDFAGLAHIRATPSLLRGLLAGVTEEESAWKPGTDRWSIAEVLAHLCHVEEHVFSVRIPKMLAGNGCVLDGYDPNTHASSGAYRGCTAADALDELQWRRTENLSLIESAPAGALEHTAVHRVLGQITLLQHMNEWAIHDLGHVKQITELIRAVRYHPNLGPWQEEYPVNP
jgi:DinB superfamily